MAFTQADVVAQAVIIGNLNSSDSALMERVNVTAGQVILKASIYIGYDCMTIDPLLDVLAEITVTQISHYQNLQTGDTTSTGATKRITRGDYTVEYDTNNPARIINDNLFNSYEWILKQYKKLRTL